MSNLGLQVYLFVLCLALITTSCKSSQEPDIEARASSREIATLVTSPEIFKVTPGNVRHELEPLVLIKPSERTDDRWLFTGSNPAIGLRLAQVEFQPTGSEGKIDEWDLLQIHLSFKAASGSLDDFFGELRIEIIELLGEPSYTKRAGSRTAWLVDRYHEISISKSINREQMVLVVIAVLQGEPESSG